MVEETGNVLYFLEEFQGKKYQPLASYSPLSSSSESYADWRKDCKKRKVCGVTDWDEGRNSSEVLR
jgi:hypothetical protein